MGGSAPGSCNTHILCLIILFCSLSGLTRHKDVCDGQPSLVAGKALVFTCTACQRTFNERRYLKQHMGGKKCERRKEFLQKTASFTLALTASPSSSRSLSTSSVNTTGPDIEKVFNHISLNIINHDKMPRSHVGFALNCAKISMDWLGIYHHAL